MFCILMKLPTSVINQRTEDMEKELALMEESTRRTIKEREVLEENIAKMTVEAMKTRIRRKTVVNEYRNIDML